MTSDNLPPPPTNPYAPPQPLPVQALAYQDPYYRRRPGIITAIGVTSIVVAVISGLGSLFSGCESAGIYFITKVSKTMSTSSIVTGIPSAPIVQNTDAMNDADRAVVKGEFSKLQHLNQERLAHLDALLSEHGASIIPIGKTPLTPTAVKAQVTRSYVHESDGPDDPNATVFLLNWGNLRLTDKQAEFTPKDGTPSMTASADNSVPSPTPSVATASPSSAGTALTPQEVNSIVQRAQSAVGGKLSTTQLSALRTALQNPNQQLIAPGTAWSPVRNATFNPDGSAALFFSGGYIMIDKQGVSNIVPFSGPGAVPMANINATACMLSVLDGLVGLGLAIYLFIAGIAVFRESNSARLMHQWYAWLKIPLAIAGSAALAWMISSFVNSVSGATPGGGPPRGFGMMMTAGFCVLGLIYPIVLLIVLNLKSVKQYYGAAEG